MFPYPSPLLTVAQAAGGGGGGAYPLTTYEAGPFTQTNAVATAFTWTIPASAQAVNTKYMGLLSAKLSGSQNSELRLNKDGVEIGWMTSNYGSGRALSTMFLIETTGTLADIALAVRLDATGNPAFSLTATDVTLTLIPLGADDEVATALGPVTGIGGTYVNACTINFTPPSSGDYIVIGCLTGANGAGVGVTARLVCGGQTTEVNDWTTGSGEYALQGFFVVNPTALSGAQSATLDFKATVHNTGSYRNAHLFVLRADRFAGVHSQRLGSNNSGTDATYTDALSLSYTPAATPHLILAGWATQGSNTSQLAYSKLVDDGSDVVESAKLPSSGSNDYDMGGFHKVATLTAAARITKLQRKTQTSATTSIKAGAAIVAFDLDGI